MTEAFIYYWRYLQIPIFNFIPEHLMEIGDVILFLFLVFQVISQYFDKIWYRMRKQIHWRLMISKYCQHKFDVFVDFDQYIYNIFTTLRYHNFYFHIDFTGEIVQHTFSVQEHYELFLSIFLMIWPIVARWIS